MIRFRFLCFHEKPNEIKIPDELNEQAKFLNSNKLKQKNLWVIAKATLPLISMRLLTQPFGASPSSLRYPLENYYLSVLMDA